MFLGWAMWLMGPLLLFFLTYALEIKMEITGEHVFTCFGSSVILIINCCLSSSLSAHLSWKLKWAFLIACRPLFVCPSTLAIFIFFSRTPGSISTKLDKKHKASFLRRFKLVQMDGHALFQGEIIASEISKIHWKY